MTDGTSTFVIRPGLAKLTGAYPSPQDVLEAAAEGNRAQAILARLWISEGIPFAFRNCPGLYEEFRVSLAERLKLDAKQISVAGSGRLGYSLAPKKWGEDYQEVASDLDLFAVSEGLFQRLCEDFKRWRDDYDRGDVEPEKKRDQYYWNTNLKETPGTIRKGFVDSIRVPNLERYGMFLAMNRCLEDLSSKLQKADEGPKPRDTLSLRCYRDWPSYEGQMVISLGAVVKYRHDDS